MPAPERGSGTKPRGVLFDYGGCLTGPTGVAVRAICAETGIAPDDLRHAIFGAYGPDEGEGELHPVHALELGRLPLDEFDRRFTAGLRTADGTPPPHEGFTRRMFTLLGPPVKPMVRLVERLRAEGVRVGLISNNWGGAEDWDRAALDDLYDAVVLSGEVGVRKPDPEVFAIALDKLGVQAGECVFVDDIEPNVVAAEALGMRAILHTSAEATVQALEEIFGVSLA